MGLRRLFDVRAGEARGSVAGFAVLLLLVIGAHTILETARDALLLTGPGPRALGFVYMVIAVCTVPAAALAARLGERFGQRRALAATLAVAVAGPLLLFLVPLSPAAAMATYVLSGLLGSIVVPQFWTLVGTVLTVAQGRRLFGLISAGGIVGGVLGPAVASAALVFLPVKSLLLVSSVVFVAAIAALSLAHVTERAAEPGPRRHVPLTASLKAFREQPFLIRVAVVVFLSTATFLALDYLFKSTLARTMPSARVAPFIAHYYFGLNCVSLVVQLLLTSAVVRRLGMLPGARASPPCSSSAARSLRSCGGGSLPSVLLVKGIDGSLRYSIHRVTGELIYLPVPPTARQRAKPLIDGALARASQTVTGAALLALGGTALVGPRPLAFFVAALATAWLATVVTMRRPYLSLLRSALTSGSLDVAESPQPIDLETAQLLVQRLASEDPFEVKGAMTALSRRGRAGFVPALVLLHHDERVLVQALEMFGESPRSDWFALARPLLHDPARRCAWQPRAPWRGTSSSMQRRSPTTSAGGRGDTGRCGWLSGTRRRRLPSISPSPRCSDQGGEPGASARLGLLAAIADAPPTPRLLPLLRLIAGEHRPPRRATRRSSWRWRSRASRIAPHPRARLVPLGARRARGRPRRAGRARRPRARRGAPDAARQDRERRLRLHMPKTLARFATRRAAEFLLEEIETEQDGLIRYKAIRALRVLVTGHRIFVDRQRAERLCSADLEDHFGRLALRYALDFPAEPPGATRALLAGAPEREGGARARARVSTAADRASPPGGAPCVHRVSLGRTRTRARTPPS